MKTETPIYKDSMVEGLGYFQPATPENDAYSTEGADASTILGIPNPEPAPVVAVSIATKSEDAPGNSLTWNSGDKGTNWMDGSTNPWDK